MSFSASVSLYCEQHCLRSTDGLFVNRNVYLYDVTSSGARDVELDAFYSFYLSQAHFAKTPRSAISHRVHFFDLGQIMRVYKTFEMATRSEPRSDILSVRLKEFSDSLRFLPRFENRTSPDYLRRPLTQWECPGAFDEGECRGFVSGWLQLLSWWRLANVRLQDACRQNQQLMKLGRTRPGPHLSNRVAESLDHLDSLMANLDLHHGSAEMAALRQLLSLERNVPEGRTFVPSYECPLASSKDTLICNITEDSKLIALVAGCSYHNVNIFFVVQRVIASELGSDQSKLFGRIEETLRPLVAEFFFEVVCPLRTGVKFEDYRESVVRGSLENFREYVLALTGTRGTEEAFENTLEHTIRMWTKTLRRCIDVSLYDGRILTLLRDKAKAVVTNTMEQLILDVMKSGVLLAHKVFQKDFVTENVLLELATHLLRTQNFELFETSCAQVAYSLVSAYRIMHSRCPHPEGCFWLPDSFPRREFVAFIDDLRATCGLQQLCAESTAQDLRHALRGVQLSLSGEVREGLRSLTELARRGNELMDAAKYFEYSKNSRE